MFHYAGPVNGALANFRMVEYFNSIAIRVSKFSALILLFLVCSFGLTAFFISSNDPKYDDQILLCLTLGIWFLLCLSIGWFFKRITPKPDKSLGFLKRLKAYIKRCFSYVIAGLFSVNTILLFWLTIKSISHVL